MKIFNKKIFIAFAFVLFIIANGIKVETPLSFVIFNTSIVSFIYLSNTILFKKYKHSLKISHLNYFRLILPFLITLVGSTVFYGILMIVWLAIKKDLNSTDYIRMVENDYPNLIGLFLVVSLFFLVSELLKGWKNDAVDEETRKYEELKFQFEILKNQINPHFLFNSLNILKSIISDDPEHAKHFVQNFSKIYRYVLEKREYDFVQLNEEIKFIEAYFYLIKSRHMSKIETSIEINGTSRFMIIPMSLQLLVENAIKHNAATIENRLLIRINIENNYIVVRNSINPKNTSGKTSKIGLNNLSKRYKFLTSKDIVVEKIDKEFVVKLPIIRRKKDEFKDSNI